MASREVANAANRVTRKVLLPAFKGLRRYEGCARWLVAPTPMTVVVLAGVAAYRAVVIGSHGEPSGLDFGNWLTLGYQILGHPIAGSAAGSYPPIVPVLTVVMTKVFGVVWGTALIAGLAGTAPGIGVYAACRLFGARWTAALAAVLLAATSSSGEAAAWGGIPQLIGLGLTAAVLALAQRTLMDRRWQSALWLGLLILVLAATSQLVLAQAAAALVVLAFLRAAVAPGTMGRGTWLAKNGWLSLSVLAVGPSLLLVPLYLKLLPTLGSSVANPGSASSGPPFAEFVQAMSVVYRDVPWLWKPALLLTLLTPVMLIIKRYRNRPLLAIASALDLSLIASGIVSSQDRLVYLAPIGVGFAMVWWLSLVPWGRRQTVTWRAGHDISVPAGSTVAIGVLAAAAVALAAWRGLAFFPIQRAFYGANQPPGTLAGLDWVREHTPSNALIAVAPVNGGPFGWWVEGYARRDALVGSELEWLYFPQERARAKEVVSLLSEPDPLAPAVLARARKLDIQYLLLPWNWGGLLPADLAVYRSLHPGSVVFDNAAMVVIQVGLSNQT